MSNLRTVAAVDDPEIRTWFYDLERGIKRRKIEEKRWRKIEQFEDLKHWEGREAEGDQVTINKLGAWLNSRLASICFRAPGYAVRANREEDSNPITMSDGTQPFGDTPRHVVSENLLNHVVRQPSFGFFHTCRRFAKGGLNAYGIIKSGYKATFEDVPDETDQMVPVDENGVPDYSGYLTDPETGIPTRDEDDRLILKGATPTSELWFCDAVSPYKMIIDPDGGSDFRQHSWVAMEIERSLDDVKADRNLKNKKGLEATGTLGYGEEPGDDNVSIKPVESDIAERMYPEDIVKDQVKTVKLFEIFDFKAKRLIVLAEGHGKYLRNDPMPDDIEHSPYVFFRPIEKSIEEFYPRPRAADLVPINEEYNLHRKQLATYARNADRVVLRDPGRFSDAEVMKLKAVGDLRVCDVPDLGTGVSPIQIITMPMIDGSVFAHGDKVSRDFDEVGAEPGDRSLAASKTATQVDALNQISTAQEDDLRNMLAIALSEVGKKLLDSLQKNMTIPIAVAIEGRDGQMFMGTVTREMIQGDFDVTVEVTEMMPRNSGVERAQFQSLLQTLAMTNPPLAMVRTPAMASLVLRMFEIRDKTARDALVETANMMYQQAPQAPGAAPGNAPQDEAQMISQQAGALGPMMGG